MRNPLLALAVSLGVALGSFGTAGAPAMAAMSAPQMEMAAPSDVLFVKHRQALDLPRALEEEAAVALAPLGLDQGAGADLPLGQAASSSPLVSPFIGFDRGPPRAAISPLTVSLDKSGRRAAAPGRGPASQPLS